MTDILFESRRDLRERAFQALMSLEYEGDVVEACRFAFTHDKEETDQEVEIPAFLLNLVSVSYTHLGECFHKYPPSQWPVESRSRYLPTDPRLPGIS